MKSEAGPVDHFGCYTGGAERPPFGHRCMNQKCMDRKLKWSIIDYMDLLIYPLVQSSLFSGINHIDFLPFKYTYHFWPLMTGSTANSIAFFTLESNHQLVVTIIVSYYPL